jgi:hypothetical protein
MVLGGQQVGLGLTRIQNPVTVRVGGPVFPLRYGG